MSLGTLAPAPTELETRSLVARVYAWMFVALLITAGVAATIAATPAVTSVLLSNQILFFGLLIGELLLVVALAGFIHRMSPATATLVFLGYSALNGVTLSLIFLAYTAGSIATTFVVTAGMFGVTSLYGYFTHTDLTRFGNLLLMALIGLVIASVVNIFLSSSALYWITTYAGVAIFVGLTAYDTQKIKELSQTVDEETGESRKTAILGALALYLDFINLFLMLLRLFGRRRD